MHKHPQAMRLLHGLVLAGLCCAEPASALSLPDCAGAVEIAKAQVARVEPNGVLALSDGRALLLEGIRLPMGEADHAPQSLADQARAALAALAQAQPLTATATPPKEDRYDRVRVQGFGKAASPNPVWLQRVLLERGLARVSISPDRDECAPDLYDAESQARNAGRGLWATPAYHVRTSKDDWHADIGTFQIVEGRIGRVASRDDGILLDFGANGRSGLSVLIAGDDRKAFRRADFDLGALEGKRVRVRGIVQDVDGRPRIALANPAQIEMLDN